MLLFLGIFIMVLLLGGIGIGLILTYGLVALVLGIVLNPIFWVIIFVIILGGILIEFMPSCLGCLGIIILTIMILIYIFNR